MIDHTVIVPIYNGSEFIHLFWTSLLSNMLDNTELVIVDDGSREDIELLVPKLPTSLRPRILRNAAPQGYAKSVNRGLAAARGKFVYLLNTDLILGQGSLALLHRYLERDDRIGVVGAKLLYPQTGKIQHFGLAFTPTRKLHIFTHMDPEHPLVSEVGVFQAVTFALCGARLSLFHEAGGLDEGFCNGSEDIDFCLRVGQSGYRNIVPPEVLSYHWESLSGDSARHLATLENEARFWGRWADRVEVDIGDFVSRSLRFLVNAYGIAQDMDFTVITFSPSGDVEYLLGALQSVFSHSTEFQVQDYSRVPRHAGQIWLSMALPFDSVRSPRPFLFVVHEYPELLGNHYWFERRRNYCTGDVIVDHYGNALLGTDPLFLASAARQKGPMDAS